MTCTTCGKNHNSAEPCERNIHREIAEQRDRLVREVEYLTNRNVALRASLEEILDEYLDFDWRDADVDLARYVLTQSTCLLSAVSLLKDGRGQEADIARLREKVEAYRLLRQHVTKDGIPKRSLSKADAERDAARLNRDAYECGLCGTWHVGNDRSLPPEDRS